MTHMKTRAWLWTAVLTTAAGVAWAQPAHPDGTDGGLDDEMSMDDGPSQKGPRRGPPDGGRGGPRGGPRGGQGMRPEGPMGAGGPEAEGPALTEAQEKELTDFLKEADPKMHERMSAGDREKPMMRRRRLAQLWKLYQDPESRALFVKRAKANASVRELVAQHRKAGEKERPALKEKLAKAVGELFDADQGTKELQLKKMQEGISKLKDKIAKRRQLKDKIVGRRVEQLMGEDDDWQ